MVSPVGKLKHSPSVNFLSPNEAWQRNLPELVKTINQAKGSLSKIKENMSLMQEILKNSILGIKTFKDSKEKADLQKGLQKLEQLLKLYEIFETIQNPNFISLSPFEIQDEIQRFDKALQMPNTGEKTREFLENEKKIFEKLHKIKRSVIENSDPSYLIKEFLPLYKKKLEEDQLFQGFSKPDVDQIIVDLFKKINNFLNESQYLSSNILQNKAGIEKSIKDAFLQITKELENSSQKINDLELKQAAQKLFSSVEAKQTTSIEDVFTQIDNKVNELKEKLENINQIEITREIVKNLLILDSPASESQKENPAVNIANTRPTKFKGDENFSKEVGNLVNYFIHDDKIEYSKPEVLSEEQKKQLCAAEDQIKEQTEKKEVLNSLISLSKNKSFSDKKAILQSVVKVALTEINTKKDELKKNIKEEEAFLEKLKKERLNEGDIKNKAEQLEKMQEADKINNSLEEIKKERDSIFGVTAKIENWYLKEDLEKPYSEKYLDDVIKQAPNVLLKRKTFELPDKAPEEMEKIADYERPKSGASLFSDDKTKEMKEAKQEIVNQLEQLSEKDQITKDFLTKKKEALEKLITCDSREDKQEALRYVIEIMNRVKTKNLFEERKKLNDKLKEINQSSKEETPLTLANISKDFWLRSIKLASELNNLKKEQKNRNLEIEKSEKSIQQKRNELKRAEINLETLQKNGNKIDEFYSKKTSLYKEKFLDDLLRQAPDVLLGLGVFKFEEQQPKVFNAKLKEEDEFDNFIESMFEKIPKNQLEIKKFNFVFPKLIARFDRKAKDKDNNELEEYYKTIDSNIIQTFATKFEENEKIQKICSYACGS